MFEIFSSVLAYRISVAEMRASLSLWLARKKIVGPVKNLESLVQMA
jgi:hypothetical protein